MSNEEALAKLRATVLKALEVYRADTSSDRTLDPVDDPTIPYAKGLVTDEEIAASIIANDTTTEPSMTTASWAQANRRNFVHFHGLLEENRESADKWLTDQFLFQVGLAMDTHERSALETRAMFKVTRVPRTK